MMSKEENEGERDMGRKVRMGVLRVRAREVERESERVEQERMSRSIVANL